MSEIIRRHAHELVGRQEVQNLLDTYAASSPKVVEELVPGKMPLGGVMRVLQNLLRENVPIRDMRTILETLADWASVTRDPNALTENVRQALARTISSRFAQEDGTLYLMLLDRDLESRIQAGVHTTAEGSYLDLDPGTAQGFMAALNSMVQEGSGGGMPTLLCQPSIRQHVRKLTERFLPGLTVLSHNEIAAGYNVKSIGTVRINNAG